MVSRYATAAAIQRGGRERGSGSGDYPGAGSTDLVRLAPAEVMDVSGMWCGDPDP
jgi:hypothetical protein